MRAVRFVTNTTTIMARPGPRSPSRNCRPPGGALVLMAVGPTIASIQYRSSFAGAVRRWVGTGAYLRLIARVRGDTSGPDRAPNPWRQTRVRPTVFFSGH